MLADGWSLVIFPEGTRSKDGWMGTFRMGAAFLAHEHGVPVVPVAHRGTFAAMPRGRFDARAPLFAHATKRGGSAPKSITCQLAAV